MCTWTLNLQLFVIMAAGSGGLSEETAALSAASLWKGENDSDVEQMETYDSNPLDCWLRNASAWTEGEAYSIYREKLVRLRSLYTSQLARLKHSLVERRREFLLEWMAAGGDREEAVNPSRGGSLEDSAYRSYRRRTGEEAVLERRQKQRQIAVSIEFFSRKDMRNSSRAHHQHLMRLQGQYMPSPHPSCSNTSCDNKCLPFSTKCRRHICEDPKQLLYSMCSYVYPSGLQCTSPVPIYLSPPLCGGHCDTAITETKAKEPQELTGTSEMSHCDGEEDSTENRLPAAVEEGEEREGDNDSSGNVTPVVATMTEGDTAETMELGKEREEKVDSMAREEETLPTLSTTTQLQDIVETL